MRAIFTVWFSLLGLTGVEVFLAYQQLELKLMLALLMGLSLIKASLIVAYFMHLRYERRSLAFTLIPALIFVVGMMFVIFPDSIRILMMRVK
ncbi:MAG TPA: cytochrome C oxidase subunit IV family protein [Terriglobia bacterium]|nr:cytochrome C oxidase subunit IV family protein [Terriglobia bacterium]